ncbi:hypothetical protein MRB53_011603 [Persea americana]|uniref:Uncharacterized protein n=1 Tax=Persea americana TaxID=3435 RepID=A0ACC2LVF7_PERAE|nr:hypothetical protein MRB53_011603 [Persea americana]
MKNNSLVPHSSQLVRFHRQPYLRVTRFRCGGFVLGIALNHCIADGTSATEFMNSWAETARGLPISNPPFLDRTILRSRQSPKVMSPHHELAEINDISNIAALYQEHQIQYKSFIFKQEQLAQLKKTAMEDNAIKNCSTFVALSAFIWSSQSKALRMRPNQETRLLFTVDGRSRFNPPLPKGFFGNGIIFAHCSCSAGELIEKPLSFAVRMVQEAIKVVNEDHLRSLIDHLEVTRASYPTAANNLLISEWSRLSFSSTDFGWGVPLQSGLASPPIIGLFLPYGEERKCINVLMCLPAPAMETFQELMVM